MQNKKYIITWGVFLLLFVIGWYILIASNGAQNILNDGSGGDSTLIDNKIGGIKDLVGNTPDLEYVSFDPEEKLRVMQEKESERKQYISLMNQVGATGEVANCESIGDITLRGSCFDNGYASLATISNDSEYCGKIENSGSQMRCYDVFTLHKAYSENGEVLCYKISNTQVKEKCLSDIILKKIESQDFLGNMNICNKLSGDTKIYCENKVKNRLDIDMMNDAMNENNTLKCNQIHNEELMITCKDSIHGEVAYKNKDIDRCRKITDSKKMISCENSIKKILDKGVYKNALEKLNIQLCENIFDVAFQMSCEDNVNLKGAVLEGDLLKCDLINAQNLKSKCQISIKQ